MFKNSDKLLFLGVENLPKKDNLGSYNKVTFANPSTFDKFSLFLPDNIKPYEQGLKNGDSVIVELLITNQGFGIRTDLKSIELVKEFTGK